VGLVDAPDEAIAAEAGVFRTRAGQLAIAPASDRQRAAHPRTLRSYRSLRAYPGAPPRIPHGFTSAEFRTGACTTCHARGGFSPRFGAYVPLTPHPEMSACLQCHVGNDQVTGVALPSLDPSARCRQCHSPEALRGTETALDRQSVGWPSLATRAPDSGPPPIPHDLQGRANCLACHSGPAAVAEIRTTHPERTNCRQCHVAPVTDTGAYVRPAPPTVDGPRGTS
jgi:cytochrome c-type protein NapB